MTQNPAQSEQLPSVWSPADEEATLYQRWVDKGYFSADATSSKPDYTIVLPPPNVTGSLHVGHALNHSVMDALTRRKRMQGYEVLWLPGMDHAGIATQNVVERALARDGLSRHDLGREKFVQRVWDWKAEYGGKILGQMRRLGDGVDWDRERFTLDEGLSKAVQTIFKKFYDDGLIYRAERIINWCPRCQTALSDIEVDHSEDDGELVSIRYGEGANSIVVATTRAETMLGDTAVAVHPEDERYQHLIGTQVEVPLTGRMVPVVADHYVDPSFGTGVVKITPAHDPNDFEVGQRHSLPAISVMDEHGVITANGPFLGLDRFEARPAVVAALREQGRIVAEKRPYRHSVGHCSRCETVIEPRLSMQWWVKVEPLARAASQAVRDGRTTIHPPEMAKRYFDWVDNLRDWCISRQLWWGHRIPVWYGPHGEVRCLGPDDQSPGAEWVQDSDVLDTWFSSGLWPFSTLGWPENTSDLAKFYPTSVLSTGYDILFFWVVRMMMFGLYAMDGTVPFKHVYLHGLVRDQFGKKMSKSSGNVIDPLDWMDTYGADATRFTLLRGANPGADISLAPEWAAGSRNFVTKLWNVSKFAMANGALVSDSNRDLPDREQLTDADQWILDLLDELITELDDYFESFQFAKLSEALYHFTWDEFCDWYVELAKTQLAEGGARQETTQRVLGHVLDVLLRLLHPLMPFVTEKIWTTLTGRESLVVAQWPTARGSGREESAAARIDGIKKLVTEIRKFRSDHGIKSTQRVPGQVRGACCVGLLDHVPAVRALTKLTEPDDTYTASLSFEVGLPQGAVKVEMDTSHTIDVSAERARLRKELATAEKERTQCEAKLNNPAFRDKAPAEVITKIDSRLATAIADIERISARLAALPTEG